MKLILKILCAPIIGLMWVVIKLGIAATYVSGLALGILSGVFAIIGIVYMFTEGTIKGLTGFAIAYLISPYGIPMFSIMLLGAIHRLRENLKYVIYG